MENGSVSRGKEVMEGPEFRKLPKDELIKACKSLCVLARSSPKDKALLVNTLKSDCNEVVGVTGDGTNDALDGVARGRGVATRPRRRGESRRPAHWATTSMSDQR